LSKEDLIEMQGKIEEILPDARYRVNLDNGHSLIAYTGGKMRKHRIKIIAGDNVTIEMSPYDLSTGRITFRHPLRSLALPIYNRLRAVFFVHCRPRAAISPLWAMTCTTEQASAMARFSHQAR
jgi:translation initiation factor IF-1